MPSYDYWIAKGFILLGDNYLAQRDTFQAKETYKSIVDNYQKESSDPDDLEGDRPGETRGTGKGYASGHRRRNEREIEGASPQ